MRNSAEMSNIRSSSEIADIIENSISVPKSVFLRNIGLAGTTLANMKNGSMPSADKLAVIADALGCSVDYLLGRDEPPENATYSMYSKVDDDSLKEELMELLGMNTEQKKQHEETQKSLDEFRLAQKSAPPESRWDAIRNIIERLPEDEIKELQAFVHYLEWKVNEREKKG